jgi:hypothetical protein
MSSIQNIWTDKKHTVKEYISGLSLYNFTPFTAVNYMYY